MEQISTELMVVIIILGLWSLIWKGIALWKSGRNNQLKWFIVILILNTVGILPIIYLKFFQKKSGNKDSTKVPGKELS